MLSDESNASPAEVPCDQMNLETTRKPTLPKITEIITVATALSGEYSVESTAAENISNSGYDTFYDYVINDEGKIT